jgi:hypothetical protein
MRFTFTASQAEEMYLAVLDKVPDETKSLSNYARLLQNVRQRCCSCPACHAYSMHHTPAMQHTTLFWSCFASRSV